MEATNSNNHKAGHTIMDYAQCTLGTLSSQPCLWNG